MRLFAVAALLLLAGPAQAQRWYTSWAGSDQGPYPVGAVVAQPDLRFAFPSAESGARDQSFRLILKPDLWGQKVRLRFSNAFGTRPVTVDGAFVGLQMSGAALVPGTNRLVTFALKRSLVLQPGALAWSDAVTLPFVNNPAEFAGRKLAVSFHITGESGPMTWHGTAMQTSYITAPGAGAVGELEDDNAFPNSTTSWYFLDALDAQAPPDTKVVVCLGDSITDGVGSTLNGDDRWPDALARRLHGAGAHVAVVNAGLSANQVVGPAEYNPAKPSPGGPSAGQRLDRDVLALSGVTDVIWLEGVNDFGAAGGAKVDTVRDAMEAGVRHLREKLPQIQVIGGTLTGVTGTTSPAHSAPEVDQKRRALNAFVRDSKGVFDGVADFDAALADAVTGAMRPEFIPNSTVGGAGDGLHPNRAGYQAMAEAVDMRAITAPVTRRRRP